MNSAYSLYIRRKLGIGSSLSYKLHSMTPLIIVMLITMVLVFSLTFILSISSAIERAIIYLGSGEIYSSESLKGKENVISSDLVKKGQGIIYFESGESLIYLKGVESDYFNEERRSVLDIDITSIGKNEIAISSTLSDDVNLKKGDKLTLLLYESDKNRTRPYLMTVSSVFDSGYQELDRYLAFANISLLEREEGGYETILEDSSSLDETVKALKENGIEAESYKLLYSSIYENVRASVSILYVIFAAIAFLAAFFSSDVARVYIDRDRKDIGAMLLFGTSRNALIRIYHKLTVTYIFIAALLGSFFGILLSLRIPSLVAFVAKEHSSFLDYYISSFSVKVPYSSILVIILLVVAVSSLSLLFSLSRLLPRDIDALVKGE